MVDMERLRELRKQRGWTQEWTAKRLGVTQAYLSMVESGRRPLPQRFLRILAKLFDLSPTLLPLPSSESGMAELQLDGALAALGYPGFRHLGAPATRRRNPAEVLAAAVSRDRLGARLVEALPWLALGYSDLDWKWVVDQAKLRNSQNRLGYVVLLARQLAEKTQRREAAVRLREVEQELERSRLTREDSFGGDGLTEAERRWLRKRRPRGARHWNLLTDLTVEQLEHAS